MEEEKARDKERKRHTPGACYRLT